MSIEVACPVCSKTSRVRDDLAGKKIRCPECGETLRVQVPATSTSREKSSGFQPWHAVALGLGFLLLGVGLTAGFLLGRGKGPAQEKEAARAPALVLKPAVVTPAKEKPAALVKPPAPQPRLRPEPPAPEPVPVVEEPAPPPGSPKRGFRPTRARGEQLAAEAVEAEKQRQIEKWREEGGSTYRLLPQQEKEIADSIFQKIQSPKGTFPSKAEGIVLGMYWSELFDKPETQDAFLEWARGRGLLQFCDNIGEPEGSRRRDLARAFVFMSPVDCSAALAVSRRIKQVGIDGLSEGERSFIQDHKGIFAAAIKSR